MDPHDLIGERISNPSKTLQRWADARYESVQLFHGLPSGRESCDNGCTCGAGHRKLVSLDAAFREGLPVTAGDKSTEELVGRMSSGWHGTGSCRLGAIGLRKYSIFGFIPAISHRSAVDSFQCITKLIQGALCQHPIREIHTTIKTRPANHAGLSRPRLGFKSP
jgi:hypothetical protein